jgi:hypothetical protein
MRSALIAPKEEFMNITIVNDSEQDYQHRKCIDNTNRRMHEHLDHH